MRVLFLALLACAGCYATPAEVKLQKIESELHFAHYDLYLYRLNVGAVTTHLELIGDRGMSHLDRALGIARSE